jgi:hypothetical protein
MKKNNTDMQSVTFMKLFNSIEMMTFMGDIELINEENYESGVSFKQYRGEVPAEDRDPQIHEYEVSFFNGNPVTIKYNIVGQMSGTLYA